MVGGNLKNDWGGMLDRLSACITPQEDAAVKRLGRDTTMPASLLEVRMHNLVAGLLVKHGLTSWTQLHASFPGYNSGGATGGQENTEAQMQPTFHEGRGGEGHDGRQSGELQSAGNDEGIAALHKPAAPTDGDAKKACPPVHREADAVESVLGRKRRAENCSNSPESPAKRTSTAIGGGNAGHKPSLADYPHVVSWWHPTKNGTTLPADYTHGSEKRVWLQCPGCPDCGEVHQWEAKASQLTRRDRDSKCPSCASKGGSFCSCRAISANEHLAAEWHEDNPSPATVALCSNKKFKWRCADAACGHVWEAKPQGRIIAGIIRHCPVCANKKRAMGKKHPSVAVGRPELLAEWDGKKNTLLPTEVSCGSSKKVWWLCQACDLSWQARMDHRAIIGIGCPRCRSR